MAQPDYQRKDSVEEVLAGWMGELEAVLYSSEVEEAIKEVMRATYSIVDSNVIVTLHDGSLFPFVLKVCPSTNPLDKKDFNPIDYINELFPNEQVCVSRSS